MTENFEQDANALKLIIRKKVRMFLDELKELPLAESMYEDYGGAARLALYISAFDEMTNLSMVKTLACAQHAPEPALNDTISFIDEILSHTKEELKTLIQEIKK